jgi:hypothetical protein
VSADRAFQLGRIATDRLVAPRVHLPLRRRIGGDNDNVRMSGSWTRWNEAWEGEFLPLPLFQASYPCLRLRSRAILHHPCRFRRTLACCRGALGRRPLGPGPPLTPHRWENLETPAPEGQWRYFDPNTE